MFECSVVVLVDTARKKSWVDLTEVSLFFFSKVRLLELQFCNLHTKIPCRIWCCSRAVTQCKLLDTHAECSKHIPVTTYQHCMYKPLVGTMCVQYSHNDIVG